MIIRDSNLARYGFRSFNGFAGDDEPGTPSWAQTTPAGGSASEWSLPDFTQNTTPPPMVTAEPSGFDWTGLLGKIVGGIFPSNHPAYQPPPQPKQAISPWVIAGVGLGGLALAVTLLKK